MSLKNKIIYSLLIFALFFTPVYLFAKSNDEQEIKDFNVTKVEKQGRNEELKQKRQEAKQKFATKREDFKQRLLQIRNKNKQAIVERVDKKITTLNQKHTDRFSNLLEKLKSILDRIASKSSELEGSGVDATSVNVSIQNARDAIDVAQTEIDTQAGKDYVIEIDAENNLGQVVSSAFKNLKDDMLALQRSVKNARDRAHDAAAAIKTLITNSKSENGSE